MKLAEANQNNILPMSDETTSIVQSVLQVEAEALLQLSRETPPEIAQAIHSIHESTGPLIVAGVGKSGHIARKIASTFRSLGKRAAFLHAAEASHGDLGIIHDDSVVLVLSNSGETTELADLLAYCRQYKIPVISITATKENTLARSSTIAIAHGKVPEACINGLAPTTSTTVALAIGDALAVGFSHLLKSVPEDFRRYHPGGKLGLRLLNVGDLMVAGDRLPIVAPTTPMHDVVITMSSKGLGVALVIDGDKTLGLITDGDMRRNVERLWDSQACDLLSSAKPVSIAKMTTASEALKEMTSRGITCLLVHDRSKKTCGLLHIHDCLRAGVE
ncbi:arabinose-5-phosphate isomerase [Yoonia maritima]|uniref:Arabinose-5-phosphate isomerase n=1 Tax=Yoonia maritima TaxID=1435347 RepID=A0A2T0VTV8_9RHOB|nr:KpsF/GutQ family sugar-phosphate isomerase [Yoonia maritima]PRY74622.1 arabinose-5-phosphate isomerase [Yoonia maritima]